MFLDLSDSLFGIIIHIRNNRLVRIIIRIRNNQVLTLFGSIRLFVNYSTLERTREDALRFSKMCHTWRGKELDTVLKLRLYAAAHAVASVFVYGCEACNRPISKTVDRKEQTPNITVSNKHIADLRILKAPDDNNWRAIFAAAPDPCKRSTGQIYGMWPKKV